MPERKVELFSAMRRTRIYEALLLACFQVLLSLALPAADPPVPVITNLNLNGTQLNLRFAPYPAAQVYSILSTPDLSLPFAPNPNFFLSAYTNFTTNGSTILTNVNYEWRNPGNSGPGGFYQLQVTPLSSNAVLATTVLNRLAYGPTPDELERVLTSTNAIGPDAYIAEQLAPELITETVDGTHTNMPIIAAKFVEATNFVSATNASISDLRAWHILRAVGAKRQLLEILLQFLENHFVTQYTKSTTYFNTYYSDSNMMNRLATQLEYLENEKWRNALLNPTCTFYDLLKISAESPAMIIYLDTVNSKGNGSNIANENYARELEELFTMGVDNGYDQNDITVMSRVWTGWSVLKVDLTNAFNPFAPQTTVIIPGSTNTSTTVISNLFGVWAFNYKQANHNTTTKTIYPNKTVPARFGPPWTTKTYGTNTPPGLYQLVVPGRSGTNGIQEGYEVITHLANLPFTEEYISIKLCHLFVHDDFPNPSNDTNSPSYGFYNYAAGNLSPEADLIHQCMLAWENSSPKGQIRPVMQTIFNSDLFRSHSGSLQKVKTPLEYVVSAIRALRTSTNGTYNPNTFTADTDGYALGGTTATSSSAPLARMGSMFLFDRGDPNGYPENAEGWISAGTLAERCRFIQSVLIANGQSGHSDAGNNNITDPVLLLRYKLPALNPPGSLTNAADVADYILSILYPGEGKANLDLYRTLAINFLNTDENGASSPLIGQAMTGNPPPYDTRVRGMVGALMTFQRFQEQ